MLGHPVAGVAEPVGELGEVERIAQRDRAGHAGDDRRKIENRERESRERFGLMAWRHQNGMGRPTCQSFFQPVKCPLRNCSAIAVSIASICGL